jgi:hypothetical protein
MRILPMHRIFRIWFNDRSPILTDEIFLLGPEKYQKIKSEVPTQGVALYSRGMLFCGRNF